MMISLVISLSLAFHEPRLCGTCRETNRSVVRARSLVHGSRYRLLPVSDSKLLIKNSNLCLRDQLGATPPWDQGRNGVRRRPGKTQVWRPHFRTWGLSEENVLYWRKYLRHYWGLFGGPRSDSAPP